MMKEPLKSSLSRRIRFDSMIALWENILERIRLETGRAVKKLLSLFTMKCGWLN